MNDKLYEFLLSQIREKDEQIYKLRVELEQYKAATGELNAMELLPCGDQVQ